VTELVRLEERGDVALVTIDRPPANAMDLDLLQAGHAVLAEIDARDPSAVVLAGREGFFSAGVDLKLAPTLDAGRQRAMVDGINRLFAGWYSQPRPVVAAVTGHAIAGGLILALCADWRVVARQGRFGLTELRAGIPYPAVAMLVVRAELAAPVARRLVLRAGLMGPEEALAADLFDEVVEPADVVSRALEVAEELAALPGGAYRTIKGQLRGDAIAATRRVLDGSDPLAGAGWLDDDTAGAAASTLRGDG
jgi:enoyl-CoA hydratase/carnithine racemase